MFGEQVPSETGSGELVEYAVDDCDEHDNDGDRGNGHDVTGQGLLARSGNFIYYCT